MPKRKPDRLDAIRFEFADKERDLVEMAIYGNAAGQVARGIGTAATGWALGAGVVAAAIVITEGVEALTNFFEKDRAEWEAKNLTPEKYAAYIQIRTDQWIAAASKEGRYAPAVGDADNYSAWRYLDPKSGVMMQAMTYEEWELKTYPDTPPMTYDQWAVAVRDAATRDRERTLGYGWLKDFTEWVGTKLPSGNGINPADYI